MLFHHPEVKQLLYVCRRLRRDTRLELIELALSTRTGMPPDSHMPHPAPDSTGSGGRLCYGESYRLNLSADPPGDIVISPALRLHCMLRASNSTLCSNYDTIFTSYWSIL